MTRSPQEQTDCYPFLGRALGWVDRPGSANRIFWALAGLCLILFLADFTYHKHGHFAIEDWPGFYAVYGFVMFTGLVIAAKTLRTFIKRPENYYGETAVDSEAYPDAELEKVKHDDV